MTQEPDAIRIASSRGVAPAIQEETPFLRSPYTITRVLTCETPIPITARDRDEGAKRLAPAHEGLQAGTVVIGPNGGEDWHTHVSYTEVVIYVLGGEATVTWEKGGKPHSQCIGQGDFFYMRQNARHRYINTGKEDLKLVWFAHYHNFNF